MACDTSAKGSAGGCGSGCGTGPANAGGGLPDHIRARVEDHPCFSEQAHHHFARMHVAVAPACNIQCHYCNRKYDCSNESRPGVVSELLNPEQAVKKTLAVAAAIPQMTVLGIAGPGDPLANPERTFATFRELAKTAPDIRLCVSTNGLQLPQHAEELAKYNIEHVTITINCVDPDIGAKIYPWIFWENRRIRGRKAAEILIKQQQEGLEKLVALGVLVKVNSVLIPGINDEHLAEVNRIVRDKGAFLHNIMPLIAEAEHGTFYGLTGQRGPTNEELTAVQDACATDMKLMKHCRQCRADAVGMLGEDRGAEFTLDKLDAMEVDYAAAMEHRREVQAQIKEQMKAPPQPVAVPIEFVRLKPPVAGARPRVSIAVATKGGNVVNEHFGHANEFLIYRVDDEKVEFHGVRKVAPYCTGAEHCDEDQSVLNGILEALSDCTGVLSAKIGIEPWEQLEAAGLVPNADHAWQPIEQAVAEFYRELAESGRLPKASAPEALRGAV